MGVRGTALAAHVRVCARWTLLAVAEEAVKPARERGVVGQAWPTALLRGSGVDGVGVKAGSVEERWWPASRVKVPVPLYSALLRKLWGGLSI